ncbi:MAG TPA: isochorismatase family cysteine hydrolase [Bryobacteraceae bacterium]|jgi:nicotinamidase/pyrazinamidase|nr:isochorismatase family cysteine hydrolase [Bryobacteraceae bacterium]
MTTVFVDVDTQIDFMFPAGALYVPGAERVLPAIARLNHFAAAQGIPLVSTTDAHAEDDPEFRQWPPHCVAGTAGQIKAPETLLPERSKLGLEPGASIALAAQIVVEKQALDVFTNPNFPALLDRLQAGRYVVYGVATDYCVRCAMAGLLATGKPVILVTDAIAAVSPADGARAIDEFVSRGGTLTTAAAVTN